MVAPIKCLIVPLSNNEAFNPLLNEISKFLPGDPERRAGSLMNCIFQLQNFDELVCPPELTPPEPVSASDMLGTTSSELLTV
jgi:hypothetical protein